MQNAGLTMSSGSSFAPHISATEPSTVPLKHAGADGPKVIVGREILQEVQKDILNMSLPSWIGRVPHDLGSASVGSLSADQWRTACTVNLVTSLVRLWGPLDETSREQQMLRNFMDLVAATKLANMRIVTTESIDEYHRRMLSYLKGIAELYPNNSLLPYHHMSLHITSFLRAFGPTHGWRCFPFERYNYLLQTINTNSKFGE